MGDSVKFIELAVFSSCNSLKSINVSENNEYYCSIDGILFNKDKTYLIQCPASIEMTEYVISDSVKMIDSGAFEYSSSLKSITIPDSVVAIDNGAFYGCSALESITIENKTCEIYDDSFTICNGQNYKNGNYEPYFNGTIYGYENSTAQAYAEKYGYNFKLIGSQTEQNLGDSNGDGKLNVRDCAFIASALAKGKGDSLTMSSDFNKDGKVNVRDAAAIASYLAKGGK